MPVGHRLQPFVTGSVMLLLSGCSSASICSVSVGNSMIQFGDVEPASTGEWYIRSLVCDGVPSTTLTFTASDAISGRCSDLGDTDVETYWKFRMGMLCYRDFSQLLEAKANVTMVPAFVTFTAR